MWPKEEGYVLAIDPATNCMGVTLWKDGELVAWKDIKSSSSKDSLTTRLRSVKSELGKFLSSHGFSPQSPLTKVVSETTPKANYVMMSLGAILTSEYIEAKVGNKELIGSTVWKSFARRLGAKSPVKGVKSLQETGWDFEKYPIKSDDIADSIHVYRAWANR